MSYLPEETRRFLAKEIKESGSDINIFKFVLRYYEAYNSRFNVSQLEYDRVLQEKRVKLISTLVNQKNDEFGTDFFYGSCRDTLVLNKTTELEYSKSIKEEITYQLKKSIERAYDSPEVTAAKKEMLVVIEKVAAEEILENRLMKDYSLFGRKYKEGMKTTKLIAKMSNNIEYSVGNISNLVGRMKINPSDLEEEIFMTVAPEAFLAAGIIGDSCMSPDAENQHGTLMLPVYKHSVVFYNQDFSWRMFGFIDTEKKEFALLSGYPVSNYFVEASIYNTMMKIGYTPVDGHRIYVEGYIDESTLFHYGIEKHKETFLENDRIMHECLYTGRDFSSISSDLGMLDAKICIGCDTVIVGKDSEQYEEFYCENCEGELLIYCEGENRTIMANDLECYAYSTNSEAFDDSMFEFISPGLEDSYCDSCPGAENCPFFGCSEDIKGMFYSEIYNAVDNEYDSEEEKEETIINGLEEGSLILNAIGRNFELNIQEYKDYEKEHSE